MAFLQPRLAKLERETPVRRSIYEWSNAELYAAIGLPRDATRDEIEVRIREVLGPIKAARLVIGPRHPDTLTPIERLFAAGRDRKA
jgi:hypothetical protein